MNSLPNIMDASALRGLLTDIYSSRGVPVSEAEVVAGHQVEANLRGHDSHGAMRTQTYVDRLLRGDIVANASFEIEHQTATTAVINGNWGFGFVQTERATDLAIAMAKSAGVAAVTIRYQGHMGRLGHYMERAADAGMIGFIAADSGRGPKAVAPFGGRTARLGTNPLAFGIPTGSDPLILDMATSALAGGKVQLARNESHQLPAGVLIDSDGRPTREPEDYFSGGALLPLGGDQGHKGYGLGVVVEVLCGLLTGLGFGVAKDARHNDGNFLAVFDVARFRDLTDFRHEMDEFVEFLQSTPTAPGIERVLVPGELETRTRRKRLMTGIQLDPRTHDELYALSNSGSPKSGLR